MRKMLRNYVEACGDLVVDTCGDLDIKINSVEKDSRNVKTGSLFVAIQGDMADGRDFIPQALDNGAAAVVYKGDPIELPCPSVRVSDDYVALGLLAELYYDAPARDMLTIGITGTNGKTTTTFILAEMFRQAGRKVGLIGTVQYDLGGEIMPADRTTPTPLELQKLLARMRENSVDVLIMEISSHAIVQRRIGNLRFDAAVFTNLSPDHLDYHGDMEHYFQSKRLLFTRHLCRYGAAILNVDDEYGRRLECELRSRMLTFGFAEDADVRPQDCTMDIGGTDLLLTSGPVHSPLIGGFNAQNVMAAAACAWACGVGEAAIRQGVEQFPGVPGRLQCVPNELDISVFIDYAHTGDALANVLSSVRPLCKQRLITVFGCGGNRDKSKRPEMGRIAAELSDKIFVTTDNPRREEPSGIINDILTGIPEDTDMAVISDRREAIHAAIEMAEPGDTIMIAGKGHEDYQEVNGVKHHFSDLEVAQEALSQLSDALCLS